MIGVDDMEETHTNYDRNNFYDYSHTVYIMAIKG